MLEIEDRNRIRIEAREYEEALPLQQRKELGQYFTGLPLGKVLAHLALDSDTRSVLDPMAGHGDLLDATWESATERGINLDRLDGIEIDEATAAKCRSRLTEMASANELPLRRVIGADAFDIGAIEALGIRSYDLVITNPPYVRYQSRKGNGAEAGKIRFGLSAIVSSRFDTTEAELWKELTENYSGLADLSVPAWLLAATLVRPGGRLALVAPATWRSRDYADVIRYLLLRCFALEYIVEDQQPGWFSDALVRTHLIVARRLTQEEIFEPVEARKQFPEPLWIQVAPIAGTATSLVGAGFAKCYPEREFAAWVRNGCEAERCGIRFDRFDLKGEWKELRTRIRRRKWFRKLETESEDLPLFATTRESCSITVPDVLREVLPKDFSATKLMTLESAGIQVGQGLRTGCNKFFYVTERGSSRNGMVRVESSSLFGQYEFSVPADAVKPVLHRQSEMVLENGCVPAGRVLDLNGWVLPEDFSAVVASEAAYAACGDTPPRIMPDELAAYVRKAGATVLATGTGDAKPIPELSAVRTNIRIPRSSRVTPRFWYMLPKFAARHIPAAFVARINHGLPWVEANIQPPLIIDANFSTFWAGAEDWTPHALKALLNSAWCRAFMEAQGTSLGGGALKLEATHLRRMGIPILSERAKAKLTAEGQKLTKTSAKIQSRIDEIVLDALLSGDFAVASSARLARDLIDRATNLSSARRRAA